jgi:hypothetical protein
VGVKPRSSTYYLVVATGEAISWEFVGVAFQKPQKPHCRTDWHSRRRPGVLVGEVNAWIPALGGPSTDLQAPPGRDCDLQLELGAATCSTSSPEHCSR